MTLLHQTDQSGSTAIRLGQKFQPDNKSVHGRTLGYIRRFQDCRSYLAHRQGRLNILSFGCGQGGEVAILREVFPDARIAGCDVDAPSLLKARETYHPGIRAEFFQSTDAGIRRRGPYDLITVNSVLCRYPAAEKTNNIAGIFPFAQFEDVLEELVANLKDGGIIVLWNTNYLLKDARVSSVLTPLPESFIFLNGYCSKFDRTGERQTIFSRDGIYAVQSINENEGIERSDLVDTIFMKNSPATILALERSKFPYDHPEDFILLSDRRMPSLLEPPPPFRGVVAGRGRQVYGNVKHRWQVACEWVSVVKSGIGGLPIESRTYWEATPAGEVPEAWSWGEECNDRRAPDVA